MDPQQLAPRDTPAQAQGAAGTPLRILSTEPIPSGVSASSVPSTAPTTPSEPDHSTWLSEAFNAGLGVLSNVNPVEIVKGIWGTVTHPIDTVTGLATAQVDQLKKAKALYDQGRYTEAFGHTMAGILPVIGPQAADIGESIAQSQTGDELARNIGKGAGFAAVMAPKATAAAAKSVVGGTAKALGATEPGQRLASIAEQQASKNITKVIAPTVGPNKMRFGNMAKDVAPRLASEEGMGAWTRSGLGAKVTAKLEDATAALDEASDQRLAGRPIRVGPIIDDLVKKRQELSAQPFNASQVTPGQGLSPSGLVKTPVPKPLGSSVVPGPNKVRVQQIDNAIAELQKLGPVASYDALKTIRQAYDGPAKVKYVPSMTADFLTKAGEASGAADVTSVLRQQLASADPATAVANKEFAFWRKASDVLQATEEVERTRPTIGRKIMSRFGGAVVGDAAGGGLGAAIGFVLAPVADAALSASPTAKIAIARGMDDLAKALKTGDVPQIESVLLRLRGLTAAATVGQQRAKGGSE